MQFPRLTLPIILYGSRRKALATSPKPLYLQVAVTHTLLFQDMVYRNLFFYLLVSVSALCVCEEENSFKQCSYSFSAINALKRGKRVMHLQCREKNLYLVDIL